MWGFTNTEIDGKPSDVGRGGGQLLSDDLVYPAVGGISNIETDGKSSDGGSCYQMI